MYTLDHLGFAYGKPKASGEFKATPEDFQVSERIGFDLTGSGEHQFLKIEKRGITTEELIKSLSKRLNKPIKNISYAGLKDRQALTTQWISIHCPGEELTDVHLLQDTHWRVIESARHLKKLKIGALCGNQFSIVLRHINHSEDLENRLYQIQKEGVPNYFGAQRFGHEGRNVIKAEEMLIQNKKIKDRFLRSIYYSAARSFLYNQILSERVQHQNWNKAVSGDVMQLSGTHSIFEIEIPDDMIRSRIVNHDISPASVLWGAGKERVQLEALDLQKKSFSGFEAWCEALEQHGLERAYRAQILYTQDLTWEWQDAHTLHLNFELPPGAYATSVLRELIDLRTEVGKSC